MSAHGLLDQPNDYHQDASADPAGSYLADNRADIEATRSGSGSSRPAANERTDDLRPHTAADDTGFCLVSNELNAALREVTGGAMANMDAPAVYLPFSKLEWLITSQPKAAAASA